MGASEIGREAIALPSPGNGTLTILLGAGASAASGLPNWEDMVANLLVNSGVIENPAIAKRVAHLGDLVLLAEAARNAIVNGKTDDKNDTWLNALSTALYGKARKPLRPSSMQISSALIACEHSKSVRLSTLNFDRLLEIAVKETTNELASSGRFSSTVVSELQSQPPEVKHLHGIIQELPSTHQKPISEPIFAFMDYLEQIKNPTSKALRFLQSSLDEGSLLIAGTSFRDPDMRQWLADILSSRRNPRKHKACILIARESYAYDGVDKEAFALMMPALEAQWKSLGFHPIFVDDFEDEAQLIRECPYAGNSDYLSPKERILHLWDTLTRENVFAEVQRAFATKLRENITELAKETGAKSEANATLWIARDSKLVRFAAHDRVYLTSELLRSDPIGFDSEFIAGQAYGANDFRYFPPNNQPNGSLGRWKTVVATPIVMQAHWCTPLPVGVLSFGIASRIDNSPMLTDILARMANKWSSLLEDCYSRNLMKN